MGFGTFVFIEEADIGKSMNFSKLREIVAEEPAAAAKSLQSCPTLCDPIDAQGGGRLVPTGQKLQGWAKVGHREEAVPLRVAAEWGGSLLL